MVAAGLQQALRFPLSPGQDLDAPAGRDLLRHRGIDNPLIPLLMDGAYEGNGARWLAHSLGLDPVVPSKRDRLEPWEYDTELYMRRNEIECRFGRIKRCRPMFTRYDNTELVLSAFITITLVANMLRECEHARVGDRWTRKAVQPNGAR